MLIAAWSAAYFAIVTVHEVGHYLAGLLIGIPRRDLRIRLLCFPQHVALRDGHVPDFTRLGHGLRNRTDCIAVLHLLPSLTHTENKDLLSIRFTAIGRDANRRLDSMAWVPPSDASQRPCGGPDRHPGRGGRLRH